jgi:hypothetical protein
MDRVGSLDIDSGVLVLDSCWPCQSRSSYAPVVIEYRYAEPRFAFNHKFSFASLCLHAKHNNKASNTDETADGDELEAETTIWSI